MANLKRDEFIKRLGILATGNLLQSPALSAEPFTKNWPQWVKKNTCRIFSGYYQTSGNY
jgi:hypothetical protein